MEDNFEPAEDYNPCSNCKYRYNPEKCIGCKHHRKYKRIKYWSNSGDKLK